MIAQHQTDAASSPSMTILTIQSACRNSPSSEKLTAGSVGGTVVTSLMTLELDARSCASAGLATTIATQTRAASTGAVVAALQRLARRSGGVSVNVMSGPFRLGSRRTGPAISRWCS